MLRAIDCTSPSCENEKDHIKLATGLYKEKSVSTPSDDVGPNFQFFVLYKVLAEHLKFIMAIEPLSKESETSPFSNESFAWSDSVEWVNENSKAKRQIGRLNSKSQKSQKDLIRKKIKFADEAVEPQKHRNKILQPQDEIESLTCKVDEEDKESWEDLSLMCQKALSGAHFETKKAEKTSLE